MTGTPPNKKPASGSAPADHLKKAVQKREETGQELIARVRKQLASGKNAKARAKALATEKARLDGELGSLSEKNLTTEERLTQALAKVAELKKRVASLEEAKQANSVQLTLVESQKKSLEAEKATLDEAAVRDKERSEALVSQRNSLDTELKLVNAARQKLLKENGQLRAFMAEIGKASEEYE